MRANSFLVIPALAIAALLVGLPRTADATIATYNFDALATGTSTPLSITNNGITATFSSAADPGGFQVFPTFFSTLTGKVLLDPGPANANNLVLSIVFSQPVSSISLLFALNTGNASTMLSLLTSAGGSASASGSIPGGFFFPEGSLIFSGAAFTSVMLSTTAPDFAIDDLVVTTPGTAPEPATLALLGLGLVGLGFARKRSQGRQSTAV